MREATAYINITKLAYKLQKMVEWQKTPTVLDHNDYVEMIVDGLKTLLIDTGRAEQYDIDLFEEESGEVRYKIKYRIDEEKYILLCAQIGFFRRVQTDVNNMVSYSTNAISTTNADKPYVHLQDTLDKLENDKRRVFYKLHPYVMGI